LNPSKKKRLSNFIRVFISFALLSALIFILRDKLPEVWQAVRTSRVSYFLIALGIFFFVQILLLAYRLKLIFNIQKMKLDFFYIYGLRFIGFFFNNFLPSAVGGDLACAYFAAQKTGKGIESFTAIFIDRLIGFVTIFALAFAAVLLIQQEIPIPYLKPILIGALIFTVVLTFFFFSRRIARPFAILVSWLPARAVEKIKATYHAIYQYRNHPFSLSHIIFVSLVLQAIAIFTNYLLALSLDMSLPLSRCFVLIPLIWVASMIPSLGGLGVREGAYVILFASYGGSEKAFALSILYLAMTICASFIGGILYLFTGRVPSEELEKMREDDLKILEKENV
jgi:uncharacterized protein (TIRG00374 family)